MTRLHLPLERLPALILRDHAELRLVHRGIPEALVRETLQRNLPALAHVADRLVHATENVVLRVPPLCFVLCPDGTVATLFWSISDVPDDFHHVPTGVDAHPVLGVQTAYLEASTDAGIDTRDILEALRNNPRTWSGAATLAHNNGRPVRVTLGDYGLLLSRLHGYPNLIAPVVRRTG